MNSLINLIFLVVFIIGSIGVATASDTQSAYSQYNSLNNVSTTFNDQKVVSALKSVLGNEYNNFSKNFDIFGEEDAVLDAQMIQLAHRIMLNLGIKEVQFQINSIGCPSCRKEYLDMLVSYFESKKKKLCKTCKSRLKTRTSLWWAKKITPPKLSMSNP